MANIVLADDHILLRNGLAGLVKSLGHTVLYEANNGKQLIEMLPKNKIPDLILMDINMPEMDGIEATLWLKKNAPEVAVLALSMYDNESYIIRMLKNGAKGYILKDSEPGELKTAIESLLSKGYYYSELVSGKLIHAINKMGEENSELKTVSELNEKETEFLKLCCAENTYKEIADKLHVSPRTVDNYRDTLFEKLGVKSRIGLVMFCIKNKILNID